MELSVNTITNYISVHHAMKLTLGSAVLCAAVTVETGLRGMYDIFQLMAFKGQNDKENAKIRNNISANIGSALFYGLCAANVIPGTAILGAGIFVIYSTIVTDSTKSLKDEYLLSKAIGQTCRFVWKNAIYPVLDNLIFPVLEIIANIASAILSQIKLPENPVWYGVALLLTGIAVAKFGVPSLTSY